MEAAWYGSYGSSDIHGGPLDIYYGSYNGSYDISYGSYGAPAAASEYSLWPWPEGSEVAEVQKLFSDIQKLRGDMTDIVCHDDIRSDYRMCLHTFIGQLVCQERYLAEFVGGQGVLTKELLQHYKDGRKHAEQWLQHYYKGATCMAAPPGLEAVLLGDKKAEDKNTEDEKELVSRTEDTAVRAFEMLIRAKYHLNRPTEYPAIRRAKNIFAHVVLPEFDDAMEVAIEVAKNCMRRDKPVAQLAAKALQRIETVVNRHGRKIATIADAQRGLQDMVVLACCRFSCTQEQLQEQGMPEPLELELNNAFGRNLRDPDDPDDKELFARLGKSKYHLFCHGQQWGKRKPKVSRTLMLLEPGPVV